MISLEVVSCKMQSTKRLSVGYGGLHFVADKFLTKLLKSKTLSGKFIPTFNIITDFLIALQLSISIFYNTVRRRTQPAVHRSEL